jgi:hypothetical protein
MTEYGLQPSYVRLDYSTPFGQHSQTLPTKKWLPSSITQDVGSYVNWDGNPIDAGVMVDDFVTKAKEFLGTDYTYDLATYFDYDETIEKFLPVAIKVLAVAGTGATTKPRQAVSQTFNFRTVGGQPSKLTFLDSSHAGADFDKQTYILFNAAAIALAAEWTDTENAWSGRDNARPDGVISVTYDLNDALRRQYRMV